MAKQDRRGVVRLLEQAPFSAMLGLKIESATNGAALVRMPFDLRLLNEGGPAAPIHGGAIAALADVAACAAVWSLDATTQKIMKKSIVERETSKYIKVEQK